MRAPLIDLAILAALGEELTAIHLVLAHTQCGETTFDGRRSKLYRLQAPAARTGYTVAVASDYQMSGDRMAQFASDFFKEARPNAAVLVGIAAAVDIKKLRVGDVVAADHIFSYANIAAGRGGLDFRKTGYPVNASLRRAINEIAHDPDLRKNWMDQCRDAIHGYVQLLNKTRRADDQLAIPSDSEPPQIFIETGAAGSFLVRSEKFRASLVSEIDSKVVWAEMEAHGFMEAAHAHDVKAIVIKGISDYGDEHKNDLERGSRGFYRLYATANAARATMMLFERNPLNPLATNELRINLEHSIQFAQSLGLMPPTPGEHILAFPQFLSSDGPTIGITLQLKALAADGREVLPRRINYLCSAGLRDKPTAKLSLDPFCMEIDNWPYPVRLGIGLAFPEAVAHIEFGVRGPFGVNLRFEWRA